MINKLLDEPYWDELEKRVMAVFSGPTKLPLENETMNYRFVMRCLVENKVIRYDASTIYFKEEKTFTPQEIFKHLHNKLDITERSLMISLEILYAYAGGYSPNRGKKIDLLDTFFSKVNQVKNLETRLKLAQELSQKTASWGQPDNYQFTLPELTWVIKDLSTHL